MKLFGIKNCDTVKKARRWLDDHQIAYQFHDLRQDGLTEPMLHEWLKTVDWNVLLNKRATTWRQLDDEEKQPLDETLAVALMLAHPTLIKRPIIVDAQGCQVGFNAKDYEDRYAC